MSSSEEDRVITWESCPNTLKYRLVDKSLVHLFTPGRKIRKRTKLSNSQLQNKHFPIENYKDYIKLKTAVLRTLSDDDYTNDETDIEIIDVHKTKKLKKKISTKHFTKSRKKLSDSSDEKSSSLSESDVEKRIIDESPDELQLPPCKLDVDERLKLQEASDNSPDLTHNNSREKTRKKSLSVSPNKKLNNHVDSPKKADDFPRENILKNEIFEEFRGVYSQDLISEGPSQDFHGNETKIEEEQYERSCPLDDDQATFDSISDSNDFNEEIFSSIDEEPAENNQQQFDNNSTIYEPKPCPLETESSFEIPSYQVPKETEKNDSISLRKYGNNLISIGHLKTRKDIKKNLNKLLDSVDSNESSDSIKSLVTDSTNQPPLGDDIPEIPVKNHEINSDKIEDFILLVPVSAELVNESKLEEEKIIINPVIGPSDSGIDDDSHDNFNKNEYNNYDVEILNKKHNPKITSDQVIASKIKIIRCKDIIESNVKILPELSPEKPIGDDYKNQDIHEIFSSENFGDDNYEKIEEKGGAIEEDCNKIVACCSNLQQNELEVDLPPVEEFELTPRGSDEETLQHDHEINKTFIDHSDDEESESEEQIEKINTAVSLTEDESAQFILNKYTTNKKTVEKSDDEELELTSRGSDEETLQDDGEINKTFTDHSDEELEIEQQIEKINTAVSLTEDESIQFILNKYTTNKKTVKKSDDEDVTLHEDEIEEGVVELHQEPDDPGDSDEHEVQTTEDLNEKNVNDESNDEEMRKKSGNKNSLVTATMSDSLQYVLDRCTSRQRYQENNPFYENESMLIDNSQAELQEEKSPEPFVPRPTNIEDFADNNNLKYEELEPTMVLSDLSEDCDFWTMEIPKSVFQDDLRGKKIKLKKRKLIIGDMKFDIEQRERENLPTVLNTGSEKRSYTIEIIAPQANVVVTGKIIKEEIIESIEELNPLGLDSESLPAESSDFKEPEPVRVKSKHKKKRKKNDETLELKEKVGKESPGVDEESIDLINKKKRRKKISDTEDAGNLVSVDSAKPVKKRKRKASEDLSDKFEKHSNNNLSDVTEPLFKKKKRKKLISPRKE